MTISTAGAFVAILLLTLVGHFGLAARANADPGYRAATVQWLVSP